MTSLIPIKKRDFMPSEKPNSYSVWTYILVGSLVGVILGIGLLLFNLNIDVERNLAKKELLEEQRSAKPNIPVRISIREALTGDGLVAQFSNNSNRFIAIAATFTNPTTNESLTTRIDISPNDTKEIGHIEGWIFESGDEILLEHSDYKSSLTTIE